MSDNNVVRKKSLPKIVSYNGCGACKTVEEAGVYDAGLAKKVDVNSDEGKELIKKNNITHVPFCVEEVQECEKDPETGAEACKVVEYKKCDVRPLMQKAERLTQSDETADEKSPGAGSKNRAADFPKTLDEFRRKYGKRGA